MATLTIHNIDEAIKTGLSLRASAHGHSIEEEARQILKLGIQLLHPQNKLGSRIHERFASVGGGDLILQDRVGIRTPPDFSET